MLYDRLTEMQLLPGQHMQHPECINVAYIFVFPMINPIVQIVKLWHSINKSTYNCERLISRCWERTIEIFKLSGAHCKQGKSRLKRVVEGTSLYTKEHNIHGWNDGEGLT